MIYLHQNQYVCTNEYPPPEDLNKLNAAIKQATEALNNAMSAENKNWAPVTVTEIGPTLNGSVRFQVVQLQCRICADVMSGVK